MTNKTFSVLKHTGFKEEVLEAAFKLVQNKDHWKGPIDTSIRKDCGISLEAIRKAVTFYTATDAVITPLADNYFRVEADGYYAGPASDR